MFRESSIEWKIPLKADYASIRKTIEALGDKEWIQIDRCTEDTIEMTLSAGEEMTVGFVNQVRQCCGDSVEFHVCGHTEVEGEEIAFLIEQLTGESAWIRETEWYANYGLLESYEDFCGILDDNDWDVLPEELLPEEQFNPESYYTIAFEEGEKPKLYENSEPPYGERIMLDDWLESRSADDEEEE